MINDEGQSYRLLHDIPVVSETVADSRLTWYCNEILKRTEGSGPISTVEFNKEGTHLAYGNGEGIVSVVEIGLADESEITHARHTCSKPYQSFQSHEPEFDCLKSQAIDEKISLIRWLPKAGRSHFLLSSNERTIKLWRLAELPTKCFKNMNFPTISGCRRKVVIRSLSDIKVPICDHELENISVRVFNKKVYARAHGFPIIGLSPSADCETFFSADPLRINMWNLEVTHEVFSIIDHTVDRLDDRSHLITGLDCSNTSPSLFAYGTNRGSIFVCDTRSNSLCDQPSITFHSLAPDEANLLTIIITSISDVKFGQSSDCFLFSRDYLTIKTWDSRMPTQPVEIHPVQTHLRSHLSVLYDSEFLFDDFKLTTSSDDRFLMTGSYNNTLKVFDRKNLSTGTYKLSMQDEELSTFIDPFRKNDGSSIYISPMPDSIDLPWPRKIVENPTLSTTDRLHNETYMGYQDANMFDLDVRRKWLQVSWRPGSLVAAASHSDGIHLIEALT